MCLDDYLVTAKILQADCNLNTALKAVVPFSERPEDRWRAQETPVPEIGNNFERYLTIDGQRGAHAAWVKDGEQWVLLTHGRLLRVCGGQLRVLSSAMDGTDRIRFLYSSSKFMPLGGYATRIIQYVSVGASGAVGNVTSFPNFFYAPPNSSLTLYYASAAKPTFFLDRVYDSVDGQTPNIENLIPALAGSGGTFGIVEFPSHPGPRYLSWRSDLALTSARLRVGMETPL